MIRHALLVDDEHDICTLLSNMLQRAGAQCAIAHSLEEGREALKDGDFDAIFLDVNLPDGLGYELIPEIKAQLPNAKLIAISAMDAEGQRAIQAGADVFVPKPFDRSIILSSISDMP